MMDNETRQVMAVTIDRCTDKIRELEAIRKEQAEEIATLTADRDRWKALAVEKLDDLLLQEIFSLREKLKIAIDAIKTHNPGFDSELFLHQLNSVDYDQLMEELATDSPITSIQEAQNES